MSTPCSSTVSSHHLAQVSVEAVSPQVVSDLVAAFRLELNKVVPVLLAPLVKELMELKIEDQGVAKELKDLKNRSISEKSGGDKIRGSALKPSDNGVLPASDERRSVGLPPGPDERRSVGLPGPDEQRSVGLPGPDERRSVGFPGPDERRSVSGAPDASAAGAGAAPDDKTAESKRTGSRVQVVAPPREKNEASQDQQTGSGLAIQKRQSRRIDSLPNRMEIEMSTPLVDPFGTPEGPARESLRWSWRRMSSRRSRSSSIRESYKYEHLNDATDESAEQAAADDPGEIPSYRKSRLPAKFDLSQTADGLSFHEKLKIAQASMMAGRSEQSPVRRGVTTFLEDPESSVAAGYFSTCFTTFSIFSIWVALLPYMGFFVPLSFNVIIEAILCFENLIRTVFSPNLTLFLSNPANLVDGLSVAPMTVIFLMRAGVMSPEAGHDFLFSAIPLIRFLRFVRRFPKMQILVTAFKDCLEALPVLLFTLAFIGCIFTSAIYLVEPRDHIASLAESAWLVISTISTVGYGDITPNSRFGCGLTSILMVVSQLYMAMPFGIIGYNFTVIWEHRSQILLLNGTRDRLAKWGFGAYEIPGLFELFDLDDSAEFDLQEFQLLFKEMDIGFKENDVVELFKLIDKDAGGTVDEKEFVKTVYPNEFRLMYARSKKTTIEKSMGAYEEGEDYYNDEQGPGKEGNSQSKAAEFHPESEAG